MTSTPKDFFVAIVGGGMCGLACAYGLISAGIKVDVFEAAGHYHEVGAGVGLGPNAIRALEGLGLFDAALKAIAEPKANQRVFNLLAGEGDHEKIFDYADFSGEKGQEGFGVYRPEFLDAVMPLLNPSIIHFNKRCVAVEQAESGRQMLRFADDTTHETDLVIGADGIKSATRTAVIGADDHRLGFSGSYAYRALVPMDALKADGIKIDVESRPHCWVGVGKHIITFPIKNDTVLNVVAFYTVGDGTLTSEHPHPWVETTSEAELMSRFSDWGNDALTILKHIRQPSRWSIHTLHPPLKNFVSDRVVLIGDAAHGMLPHLGAGVGQGFEDTYALCRLLVHPDVQMTDLDVRCSQNIYNDIRPPRANMVLEKSIRMGKIYENYGPGLYDIPEMVQWLAGMWEPIWNFDLQKQVTHALQDFEKLKQKN